MVNSWPNVSAEENTVYLAFQGAVYAVNAQNGALVCKFPEKPNTGQPFYAAPAVGDDILVVGNYGHVLYGLNKTCGDNATFTTRWEFNTEVDDPNRHAGNFAGSAAIVGDIVLAPSTNNRLYALSVENGRLLWMYETGNALWTAPVSDGETAFLAALDHNLYALELETGSLVWKVNLGSALTGSPVLTEEGVIYQNTLEGELVAVNSEDGSVIWRTNTGGRLWSAPLLHEDVLYAGNAEKKVSAISAEDGSVLWQKDLSGPIIGGGVLVDDGVAFPTEDGNLVALSLDGQSELWRQSIGGKLYTTPVRAGNSAVVALMESEKLLQAVNLNGQLGWTFNQPQ